MRIQWTSNSNKNLKQIQAYISKENPTAALDTIIHIIETVELLKQQPAMGRPGRLLNTRELIISGTCFIVPYRIKKNVVEILRVFHSSMKWND